MPLFIRKQNKRKGFSLLEALFTVLALGVMISAVMTVASQLNIARTNSTSKAAINAYNISVIEAIQNDLDSGVDIIGVDYKTDSRTKSEHFDPKITINFQNDVFGKPLYMVTIDVQDKKTDVRNISRLFLRERCELVNDSL